MQRTRKPTKRKATKGNGTSQGRRIQPKQLNRFNPILIPFTQPEMDRVYAQIFALGFSHWDSEYGAELLLCRAKGETLTPADIRFLRRIHEANQASKSDRPIDCPLERAACHALADEIIAACGGDAA